MERHLQDSCGALTFPFRIWWFGAIGLTNSNTPAVDNCGLTAFPVSMSAREILAAVPRGAASRNSTMFARVEIDPEGKAAHLRVLRLAHPELPNAAVVNEQAVDSIKRWGYAPTRIAGQPVPVCSDVEVIIDLQ